MMAMAMELTFFGHSAWELKTPEGRLLIDPFFTGNPAATIAASEAQADFIALTHGHGDHVGDCVDIAMRTGRKIQWDPVKETIVGDDTAARMMHHRDDSGERAQMAHAKGFAHKQNGRRRGHEEGEPEGQGEHRHRNGG
jgi:L-ascorbate metabolism protein UlaG (beta-lactamase superfamily)